MSNSTATLRIWVALLLSSPLLLTVASGCSRDCTWGATVQAFIDDNRNGVQDAGELPLEGAEFLVKNAQGKVEGGGSSDTSGWVYAAFFAGCSESESYVIEATPPAGFVLTTPGRIDTGSKSGKTFSFGFARQK